MLFMLFLVYIALAVGRPPPPVPSELFHFTVQTKMDAGPNRDIGHAGFPGTYGATINIDGMFNVKV